MHRKANIVTIVKVRRLEWAGRLVRMCDEETLNKVFMEKPERLRWLDCIEKWSQSMIVKRWRKKALVTLLETVCLERRRWHLFRH
jgi:hypothetical protein